MKLQRNPLALDPHRAHTLQAASLSKVLDMLRQIQSSIGKQTQIVERVTKSPPSTQREIDSLLAELDRAASAVQFSGSAALDGRYARDSKTASMWISTGIHNSQRERLFLPAAGSEPVRKSGLKPGMKADAAARAVAHALDRFRLADAQVEAYRTRFGFTRTLSDALGRMPGMTRGGLLHRPVAAQKLMARQLLSVLETLRLIGARMTKRFQEAGTLKSAVQRIGVDAELSQLTDEIDRIASQSEFNRMALILGDFAPNSRVASMWFVFPGQKEDRQRVYIGTMTSRALGLKLPNGDFIAISQSARGLASVKGALDKIEKQRRETEAILTLLEKSREIA